MKRVSIIGLGLIGGSIAKALKSSGSDYFISAYDEGNSTIAALQEGVIDESLENIDQSVNADLIFVCTPLDSTLSILSTLAGKVKEGTIVTDVSGVKLPLRKKWDSLESKGLYVGGHPMTGKEKGGYENSDPLLFENAVYILDDCCKDSEEIKPLLEVIKSLGARIAFLKPRIHDIMISYVSHLPQVAAVSLINVAAFKEESIRFLDFAAGGFRDLTRIASSPFEIWESVIRLNGKEISEAIDSFVSELKKIKEDIEKNDFESLKKKFNEARRNTAEVPQSGKGFLSPLYDISVFVEDEPGVISKISTELFKNNINIKDIELLKIREGTGGTFRLAFETAEDSERAKEILTSYGFKVL